MKKVIVMTLLVTCLTLIGTGDLPGVGATEMIALAGLVCLAAMFGYRKDDAPDRSFMFVTCNPPRVVPLNERAAPKRPAGRQWP